MNFNPETLREIRLRKGMSMAQLARRTGTSPAQIQRLETGKRRLTIDMLLQMCDALDTDIRQLFTQTAMVPITGIVTTVSEVLPLPPNSEYQTPAPNIVPDPKRLAAVRYEPEGRVGPMLGHLLFFYADINGVPDFIWGQRCIVRRSDGTLRLGWPLREGDGVHINDTVAQAEFNVRLTWASPILAVIPPFLFANEASEIGASHK